MWKEIPMLFVALVRICKVKGEKRQVLFCSVWHEKSLPLFLRLLLAFYFAALFLSVPIPIPIHFDSEFMLNFPRALDTIWPFYPALLEYNGPSLCPLVTLEKLFNSKRD